MGNCCFRSALRVLAVAGAVSALSATTMGQTLNRGSKVQASGKQLQPVQKSAPVKKLPVQYKQASPDMIRKNLAKPGVPSSTGSTLTPFSKNVDGSRDVVGRSGANDNCASPDAYSGSPVNVAFDLSLNTTGAEGQNNATCLFFGQNGIGTDEWIVWTANATGTATVATCGGTSVDTKIAVYDGAGCPAGEPLACNDDACGLQSSVAFNVVSGQQYTIQLGRYPLSTSGSTGTLTITGPGGGGGGNDDCATATDVGEGTFDFDTSSATPTPGLVGACAGSDANRDVYFNYTPSMTGVATVQTCNLAGFDTALQAFDNCPPGSNELACNDDNCGLQSRISFPVTQGVPVKVRVTGFSTASGAGQIQITVSGPVMNDDCANAEAITGNGPFNFDNSTGTQDGAGDPLCLAFGSDQVDHDVWFCWTASCNEGDQATLETCAQTGVDTKIAVYDGCTCPTGAALACNDDSCGLQSRVRWNPVPGNTYLIRVGTFPGAAGGPGSFSITCAPAPVPVCTAYDPALDCQTSSFAIAYNVTNFTLAESYNSNGQAVTDICLNGLYFANVPVPDSWVISFAEDTGSGVPGNIIDTFTQGTDMVVSGPTPTGATFVGRDVMEWNLNFARPVTRPAGECVWVIMSNFAAGDSVFLMDGDASNGNLQAAQDLNQDGMFQAPGEVIPDDIYLCVNGGIGNTAACLVDPCEGMVPPNDECSNATPLSVGSTLQGDTSCANPEAFASCSGSAWANAVWYSVTGTGNTMTVDTCASANYDTRLEVFCGGDCFNPICVGSNDDFCGLQSGVTWCTAPGATYLVAVHGFGGSTGAFDITLTDDGTPCANPPSCQPCLGIDPNPAGNAEGEDCGGDNNGGCGAAPPTLQFRDVTCDEIINGTTWAQGGTRDTDWYRVTVPASGEVSATITAEVPAVAFVLTISETGGMADCAVISVLATTAVMPCGTSTVTAAGLAPGTNAYIFVSTGTASGGIFDGFACGNPAGNDYVLEVDIDTPCGPTCPCDFNNSGNLNSQDFFDFLTCFFGGACPPGQTADFNGDTLVNSQDFFDFLSCFFAPPAGCN